MYATFVLNLRSELRSALVAAIQRAQKAGALPAGEVPAVVVEHPPERGDEPLGDYACPAPLALARQWKKKPREVAETIVAHFEKPEFVDRLEVVDPGYLNLHLNPAWLTVKMDDVLEEGGALARTDVGGGTSVNLEFVSANPTGEPHVGNGRALFTADVLGRVLAHAGYVVTREYYVNDVGTQVERYGESVLRRILQAEGHAVDYPEELYQGDDIARLAAEVREEMAEDRGHVFSPTDLDNADVRADVTRRAVDATLRVIRHVLENTAQVTYDVWLRESTLHASGAVQGVLHELARRGATEERAGAVWLKTTDAGDDKDRVLVRANGEPTYLVSDIAYHRDKLRRGAQLLVDFWGADHQGHILPLRAGLAALGEDPENLRVVLVHLVRVLQGGEAKKISKRLGTAVSLREVLELVGLSAARFFLTSKSLQTPFDFDLDLARAQREENPVYYVQYAYVRLASILRKAKQQNVVDGWLIPPATGPGGAGAAPTFSVDAASAAQALQRAGPLAALTQPSEVRLLAFVFRFQEVLEDVVRTWEVHRLPQYALDLARATHRFYDTVSVLSTPEPDLLRARLALVVAVQVALAKVFDLLGVEKREVM